MSQQRKLIRQKIKATLLNKTRAGDRVYTSRPEILPEALFETGMPAIVVYTPGDRVVEVAEAPKTLKRTATLNVELVVKGVSEFEESPQADDELDDFAQEVEQLLFALTEEQVGGELRLTGDDLDVDEKGRMPIGGAILHFEVNYWQEIPETAPPPGITDLDKVGVDYNLEGGAPVDAEDEITP